MDIDWIKQKVAAGEYELSGHAEQERQADKISMEDLEYALMNGELLEDYPDDPRGPSCLVLGFAQQGYPIHVVCGKTSRGNMRIITVYIPMPPKWLDPRTRRR